MGAVLKSRPHGTTLPTLIIGLSDCVVYTASVCVCVVCVLMSPHLCTTLQLFSFSWFSYFNCSLIYHFHSIILAFACVVACVWWFKVDATQRKIKPPLISKVEFLLLEGLLLLCLKRERRQTANWSTGSLGPGNDNQYWHMFSALAITHKHPYAGGRTTGWVCVRLRQANKNNQHVQI